MKGVRAEDYPVESSMSNSPRVSEKWSVGCVSGTGMD